MYIFSSFLKRSLPPAVSYKLRLAKSLLLDRELSALVILSSKYGNHGQIAIDVGANAGLYSSVLARHFGRVISIEPHPSCAQYLRKVLPHNCTLVEKALSDRSGRATLRVPCLRHGEETTRSTLSVANNFDSISVDKVSEIEVDVATLDDILDELRFPSGAIGLLKVDVEGHELAVFKGAKNVLQKGRPVVMAELEQRHGTPVGAVNELFRELGYGIFYMNDGRLMPCGGNSVTSSKPQIGRAHAKPQGRNVNFVFIPGYADV